MGIPALQEDQVTTDSIEVDYKSIFDPFYPKKGKLKPSRLIRLFASSKESFKKKYLDKLPEGYQPDSSLTKLLDTLDKPVCKKDFPDFLRALGAVCDRAFIGPKRMLFDISYGCNLDCVYCRRHSAINPGDPDKADPRYESNFLPVDHMISILDDAKDLMVEEILLVGGGEPTIHPDFEILVKEVKKRGLGLNFSTNGLALRKKLVDVIVDNEVDNITISVSGVSFESYKATHPMMSKKGFEKLFHNFEYLNYKKRQKVKETGREFAKPFTLFLHVITSDNYHEVEDMIFTGKEYGFDTIWFKLVHPSEWSRHLCLNQEQAQEVRETFLQYRGLQEELEIKIDDYLSEEINNLDETGDWSGYFHEKRRCFVGWNFSYVDLSKDYSFCCGDKIVGLNKEYDSFYDFWTSPRYQRARRCARDINFGENNIKTYNDGAIIDDFCKSCDNTNFNNEMEKLMDKYTLDKFLPGA